MSGIVESTTQSPEQTRETPNTQGSDIGIVRAFFTEKKKSGSTYTPENLARFVARKIAQNVRKNAERLRVLDPAVGDGELLLAIVDELREQDIEHTVYGFDTNAEALERAQERITSRHPDTEIVFEHGDFLIHVLDALTPKQRQSDMFYGASGSQDGFDIVIANPPYVRTQVLGGDKSSELAKQFGLSGRTDLYHAFILAIAAALKVGGELGIIVSNRFMTTKSGMSVRECFSNLFELHHVFDLGDTKLFEEAVLPAVVIGRRATKPRNDSAPFTKCYSTKPQDKALAFDAVLAPIADGFDGTVQVNAEFFEVTHGTLDSGSGGSDVWRISTPRSRHWLSTVERHQASCFKDIGRIRVGVKTTSDKVFIRTDWDELDVPPEPGVLFPLITHRQAARWKAHKRGQPRILYTHQMVSGRRRPIDLEIFPKAAAYLESKRSILERREYVIKAGREWFEIWVPQNPALWSNNKLVFRDIAEQSTFFLDRDGSVVNGDCYWLILESRMDPDVLWLALAVGNSSFILRYYDERFHNKLYANRRRFMTQYVEQFPLPSHDDALGRYLIQLSKDAYKMADTGDDERLAELDQQIDDLVWTAFGLVKE